jgi:hypothetical protein
MKKKYYVVIAGGIIILAGVCTFLGLLLVPVIIDSYYSCRHMEEPHTFCFDVMNFIDDYYKKNQIYPSQIDVTQFRLYSIEPFRHYLDTFHYESTGDSFTIFWSYPREYKGNETRIFKCKGTKGKMKYDWYDNEPNELSTSFHIQ